ncbi:hypothetical protein EVAR_56634_1 [Eumeta japonica]|uniref:Uncharacterized protein n=1 Tax=Eumeta variegata TaxID=151549 RepID=A0A4C1XJA4_EUMVA|nr:hypothetical protein EVAR_56634_1 [Eumeta japonica]
MIELGDGRLDVNPVSRCCEARIRSELKNNEKNQKYARGVTRVYIEFTFPSFLTLTVFAVNSVSDHDSIINGNSSSIFRCDPCFAIAITVLTPILILLDHGCSRVCGERTASYAATLDARGECVLGLGDMDVHRHITSHMVDKNEELIMKAPLVVLDGNVPQPTMEHVLRLCREKGIPDPPCHIEREPLLDRPRPNSIPLLVGVGSDLNEPGENVSSLLNSGIVSFLQKKTIFILGPAVRFNGTHTVRNREQIHNEEKKLAKCESDSNPKHSVPPHIT